MQAIRSRDTAPERAVRRFVYAAGLRYRVHFAPLPGLRRTADLVFTRRKIAVLIDGCFWHGCPEHTHLVRQHSDYWAKKLEANAARDLDTDARLMAAGWSVLRFWEHEDPLDVGKKIVDAVREAVKDEASDTTIESQ